MKKPLYLSTTSSLKLKHYQEFFIPSGYEIVPLALDLPELQSMAVDEVVTQKLRLACSLTPLRPLIVDDVGLGIPAFMGFPGAFLKPILERGGLRLLRDLTSLHTHSCRLDAELVCGIAMAFASPTDPDASNSFVKLGFMKGTLDFNTNEYLEDRATVRCFYPEGSTESVATLSLSDAASGFRHRFHALEQVLAQLQQNTF